VKHIIYNKLVIKTTQIVFPSLRDCFKYGFRKVSSFAEYENNTDILLLGPQVSFLLKKLKVLYEPKGISVSIIDSIDYGMMNGEKVLKKALGI
jgi:cellobiose-specific phosphotransferase system component IIB